jgi:hypothetical protein
MDAFEEGWIAGWLEGEGTFHCTISKPTATRKAYRRLVVRAVSTDYDTVVRAQTYAGGDIYGPYQYGIRQPHWQWGIGGNEPAAEFMRMIRPLMGQRRQKQIDEALAKASDTNN